MDLNTMYQNGMGNFASLNAGRQLAADQQMAQAKLQEQQLANNQSAVMNPLNAQFRQGQIAQQQAELPGIVGQSQTQASQGQTEAATTGAKIAQRLSSLGNQIGVDGMQKMGREGEIALQASQALKQYPPALHKEVLTKIMQTYGANPDSPIVQGILKLPDNAVQAAVESMGTGMAMASKDYLTKSSLQKSENDSQERIADTHAAAQIYTAKINAASREAAARARADAMSHGKMSVDQAIAMLELAPDRTPEEDAKLVSLKKQQLQARAAGANALPANVLGQNTPLENAAAAAGSTATPTSKPAGGDIGSQVTAAGLQYEPDKYEYAQINGVWKRRPKR